MKRQTAYIALGASFALLVAGASLPLRLVLDGADASAAGLSARAVEGSIWGGQLQEAQFGQLPLGRVQAALSPLALLSGKLVLNIERADEGQGELTARLHGSGARGLSDANGSVALGAQIGGFSVKSLSFEGLSLRFSPDGECVEADGRVTAALSAAVAGLSLSQGLSGPLSCADGRASVALSSQSGMESLRLSFTPDGAWKGRFLVGASSDPMLVQNLGAMGFQPVADGYALSLSGRI